MFYKSQLGFEIFTFMFKAILFSPVIQKTLVRTDDNFMLALSMNLMNLFLAEETSPVN